MDRNQTASATTRTATTASARGLLSTYSELSQVLSPHTGLSPHCLLNSPFTSGRNFHIRTVYCFRIDSNRLQTYMLQYTVHIDIVYIHIHYTVKWIEVFGAWNKKNLIWAEINFIKSTFLDMKYTILCK